MNLDDVFRALRMTSTDILNCQCGASFSRSEIVSQLLPDFSFSLQLFDSLNFLEEVGRGAAGLVRSARTAAGNVVAVKRLMAGAGELED
jgi:hypothetical protein